MSCVCARRSDVFSAARKCHVFYPQCLSRHISNVPIRRASPPQNHQSTIEGYVHTLRKQKNVVFAAIRDGRTTATQQAILSPDLAADLSVGAAVRLYGQVRDCPPGKEQSTEFRVAQVQIMGENDMTTNPLQAKYHTAHYLRTIPHLRARLPLQSLLLRLRSQVIASATQHFAEQDFVQTHTPVITSSDCEGAGEVFTVTTSGANDAKHEHFYKTPKYLTVSAQLHLEALAQAVAKVWTLSPTFRAEKSDTPRHLSEFYMLEAEICFITDLDKVMQCVELLIRAIVRDLQSHPSAQELLELADRAQEEDSKPLSAEVLRRRWSGITAVASWPRVSYEECVKTLQRAYEKDATLFSLPPSYEDGLQAEHERYLARTLGIDGSPIFVTHYPKKQKPFYMLPSTDDSSETVACFDLLVPELCELAGGSMREHRSRELMEAMRNAGIAIGDSEDHSQSMQWYLDLRKYGSVPHGGFGLGFDRLLCYLSGINNVRDIVAFPRWYGRCHA